MTNNIKIEISWLDEYEFNNLIPTSYWLYLISLSLSFNEYLLSGLLKS